MTHKTEPAERAGGTKPFARFCILGRGGRKNALWRKRSYFPEEYIAEYGLERFGKKQGVRCVKQEKGKKQGSAL